MSLPFVKTRWVVHDDRLASSFVPCGNREGSGSNCNVTTSFWASHCALPYVVISNFILFRTISTSDVEFHQRYSSYFPAIIAGREREAVRLDYSSSSCDCREREGGRRNNMVHSLLFGIRPPRTGSCFRCLIVGSDYYHVQQTACRCSAEET